MNTTEEKLIKVIEDLELENCHLRSNSQTLQTENMKLENALERAKKKINKFKDFVSKTVGKCTLTEEIDDFTNW